MEPEPSEARDGLKPRFIFGPLGDGYRLTKTERRISEAIGLAFVLPACALVVLLKMDLVGVGLGLGGGAALSVAGFVAMKLYVSLAGIPRVKRPFPEKFFSNISPPRDVLIYGLPIAFGLAVAALVASIVFIDEAGLALWLMLAVAAALFLASLAYGAWIKRKLAEHGFDEIE